MMTREEVAGEAKKAMDQDIKTALQGVRARVETEMTAEQGKPDLLTLLLTSRHS